MNYRFLATLTIVAAMTAHAYASGKPTAEEFRINARNAGIFGKWGAVVRCPSGTYATGVALSIEPRKGRDHDDTGANRVRLYCTTPNGNRESVLESDGRLFGTWSETYRCPRGQVLYAYRLGLERHLGSGHDDTMANSLEMRCRRPKSYGEPTGVVTLKIMGPFHDRWTAWESCPVNSSIAGMQTKDEEGLHSDGDDTALNDVAFYCKR